LIAVDTNVIVRLLVEDDEAQTARARDLFVQVRAQTGLVYISDVVLVETAWVLRACYRFDRGAIADVLRDLLDSSELTFTSAAAIEQALEAFVAGRGDFSDYMIREHGRSAGAEVVYSFDGVLKAVEGFHAP
jgi:predicted nucleic-acid-binding protein